MFEKYVNEHDNILLDYFVFQNSKVNYKKKHLRRDLSGIFVV